MNKNTKGLIDIGKLVLTFAKINRVTLHEDGKRKESDTDHTVMLSVSACSLAQKLYPNLDLGKVAQFSIVHDLVEAYAGDTNTFNISESERKEKENREELAYERIKSEFKHVYPWISDTIEDYESLVTDEAQFVKMVDKVMTKLTHRINQGAYLRNENVSKEETLRHYGNQTKILEDKYGVKFPEVIEILKQLTDDIIKDTYDKDVLV
jgi:5'-deoxynucleotidase YfbR-like HD superfamily hydrolase